MSTPQTVDPLASTALPEPAGAPVIRLHEVSKWYGEVLGLSRVTLDIRDGITTLVGPNGSGKSTLMNLLAGLIRPSMGRIDVMGVSPDDPERLNRTLGYCTQHDSFPRAFTGEDFLACLLRTQGRTARAARDLALASLERVGLGDARGKKIGAYSKGMRQRLKLALALAHEPPVLILDEPLNGLDPLARSEVLALFRDAASHGRAVLISSHVLHEVDLVADQVLMLHHGFLVAEGGIRQVREEITDRPFVVSVACDRPGALGGRALSEGLVLGARVHAGRLLAETFRLRELSDLVGRMAAGGELTVEGIDVADENVQAVYDYLIRGEEAGA